MSAKNIKFRVRVKPNTAQPICKIVSVVSDREKDRNECELWSELFAKEINELFKLKEEA